MAEEFTPEERAALAPYFTNLDGPVFALVNLPEVVKGALFARYSRSPKSLRRLFLDEFLGAGGLASAASRAAPDTDAGTRRAEQLYERVFVEYGDDSVAQLGGVHLACEGASNILTKVLEWGRLMAYLEQSTRYIPYDDRPQAAVSLPRPGRADRGAARALRRDARPSFDVYRAWLPPLRAFFERKFPRDPAESESVYRMTIRAKALDTLRGLLPAATTSNVGIYGTGQGYEQLLLRMRAHPLREVRDYADLMLVELRKVIPAFLRRVDVAERGGAWIAYLEETRRETRDDRAAAGGAGERGPVADDGPVGGEAEEVTLTDFDPDGEAEGRRRGALRGLEPRRRRAPGGGAPDDTGRARARCWRPTWASGSNRRHRPGRAFERTSYRFDVLGDYGAFRDLQRHRLLTLEWQRLTPRHGYVVPEAIAEAGAAGDWGRVMDESAEASRRDRGGRAARRSHRTRSRWRIACASTWR